MYICICIYIYVYVYVCVYICTHDMQTSSATNLLFRSVPFGVCLARKLRWRRDVKRRNVWRRNWKLREGAAWRCIPWTPGITGHHWASLGITGHHWATVTICGAICHNTFTSQDVEHIWTLSGWAFEWFGRDAFVHRLSGQLHSFSMSFMFSACSWSAWVPHFVDMLRYLSNPSDTVCFGDIQQARWRGG